MEIRLKRVPFNIELAKKITDGKIKGAKIMTGYGQPVRILCFDLKGSYPIAVAVLHNNGQESICTFTEKGYFLNLLKGDKDDICLYVPISYYDYSNFEPQKCQSVLVRDLITDMWIARVATGERTAKGFGIISVAGENKFFAECLPICNLTIKLLGTRMSYDELFEKTWQRKEQQWITKFLTFTKSKPLQRLVRSWA